MEFKTTTLAGACETFEPPQPTKSPTDQKAKANQSNTQDDKSNKEKRPSQRELLISSASADILWQDSEGTAYATVTLDNGAEAHFEIRGSGYRKLLNSRLYQQTGCGASKQAIEEALCTLEARAQHEGLVDEPSLRSAFKDGIVYFDSGNAAHDAFEITPNGWREIKRPPVKFLQPRSMLPSAIPVTDGTIQDWNRYLSLQNINNPDSRLKEAAHNVQTLIGKGPFPIKIENGPQGTGKSTRGRALKRLLDPSKNELRNQPKDEADLFIAAKNCHLMVFDNLSNITSISDGLCKLATGGSYAKRELYSNAEELIISACRAVVANGITEFAHRADLLDRALFITAETPTHRKTEVELWRELDELRPKILGFLFSAVSYYLKNVDDVRAKKTNLARMADFHVTGSTIETFFGFKEGDFDRAYRRNHNLSNDIALESNPVAVLIREHIIAITGKRPSTKLLQLLRDQCSEADRKLLPRTGKGLSDQLKRIKLPLETCGIEFTVGKDADGRFITITNKGVEKKECEDDDQDE